MTVDLVLLKSFVYGIYKNILSIVARPSMYAFLYERRVRWQMDLFFHSAPEQLFTQCHQEYIILPRPFRNDSFEIYSVAQILGMHHLYSDLFHAKIVIQEGEYELLHKFKRTSFSRTIS